MRELEQLATGGLTAIDRVFALQYVPLFRKVSADEMRHLASVAAPITMKAGAVLFPESAPPAIWLLLTGEVVLESSTGEPAHDRARRRRHRSREHDGRAEPGPERERRQRRHRPEARSRGPVRRPRPNARTCCVRCSPACSNASARRRYRNAIALKAAGHRDLTRPTLRRLPEPCGPSPADLAG